MYEQNTTQTYAFKFYTSIFVRAKYYKRLSSNSKKQYFEKMCVRELFNNYCP